MSLKDRVLARQRRQNGERIYSYARAPSSAAKPKPADIEDPNKPHPLDAPHIRAALEDAHVAREEGLVKPEQEPDKDPLPQTEQRPRLTQYTANCVRCRVLRVRLDSAIKALREGMSDAKARRKYGTAYLWFPEPYADHYELRVGNPPSDSDRPKHMSGLNVVVDIWDPRDLIEFAGSLQNALGIRQATAWHKTAAGILVPR